MNHVICVHGFMFRCHHGDGSKCLNCAPLEVSGYCCFVRGLQTAILPYVVYVYILVVFMSISTNVLKLDAVLLQ